MYSVIHIHTHACTLAHLVILIVHILLQAELAPKKCINNMSKAQSQHAAQCNGNHGDSLSPPARIATGGKYPGGIHCLNL